MDISIVIPAFEENKKIAGDIRAASAFILDNSLTGEIIVVDDGSRDNTSKSAKNVSTTLPKDIPLKVICYDGHRGKGYAVRAGIKQSSGEYVIFADAGCCVPYENALRGLNSLKSQECEIAHGSRKLQQSKILKPQGWYRRACSVILHWFVIYVMKIDSKLTDTQCGFKVYRGDVARKLYGQCIIDGFIFDVETIMRAKEQGYRIKEFPIEWTCDRDSRLAPMRGLRRVLFELFSIKRAMTKT